MKHFDALKADELRLFIIGRHLTFRKKSDVAHLKHPREKRALEAATNGEENCISVAYGWRNVKRRLLAPNEVQISAPVIVDAVRAEPLVVDVNLYPPELTRKPSDILRNPTMVELMISTFDSSNTLLATDVSSEASLAMADLLYIRLKSRLQIHINAG